MRLIALALLLPLLAACNLTPRLQTSADGQSTPLTGSGITLRNAGGGTLYWEASSDNPYLVLKNMFGGAIRGGSLAGGQSVKVFFSIDGRLVNQDAGFNASVTFSSNGGNRTVPISLGTAHTCQVASSSLLQHAASKQPVAVGNEILISYAVRVPAGTLSAAALEGLAATARAQLSAEHELATLEVGYGAVPDLLLAPQGADVDALVARLATDPRVASVQRNYYVYLQQHLGPPSDPYYGAQWALTSFGVSEAWAHLAGAAERQVVLAVLDSGVDSSHPDLAAKMLPGYDFFRNSPAADPVFLFPGERLHGKVSHGTHVAGIAAALSNDLGVIGVAFQPEVKVLPVKLFDDCGDVGKLDALVKAVRWAAGMPVPGVPTNPNPADIINLSLGLPGRHPVLDEATSAAFEQGALVIAAAGNHTGAASSPVLSPANGPDVLAVGSVDQDRRVSNFSNSGPQLDVVAPGGFGLEGADEHLLCGETPPRVISTVPHLPSGPDELGYACMAGTSMASPFVSGVAALLMLQDATLTATAARDTLIRTALLEAHMTDPDLYGAGLVCADAALGAATRCGAP